ncbi:molybdenum cofactor guanylyltransferase MobA [Ampullimonas aquatilis]|uniref:molybdenum cofactor guanylyltransferase MobA n=1 Tax=Ampullimonas aquatilis TaxID=1341549 RepID=UPI003C721582
MAETAQVISSEHITGLVLAGGQSTRMGGKDKGLLVLQDRPLIAHAIDRLKPQVGPILISANRHLEKYLTFKWPVINDSIAGYPGPLAGILAGLQRCATPYMLVVPCDSPTLPMDLATRLANAITPAHQHAAAVVVSPNGLEPLFCLLQPQHATSLEKYLQSGQRKVVPWLKSLPLAQVNFDDIKAFANLNTPEDLQQISSS